MAARGLAALAHEDDAVRVARGVASPAPAVGSHELWARHRPAEMPPGVARLRAHFEADPRPVAPSLAARIITGRPSHGGCDRALALATFWLPELYQADDGCLFFAGVVDDADHAPAAARGGFRDVG